MTNIFNNLMISSPNQNGGLFFLSNGKFTKIDSFATCGITLEGKFLARGAQPDTLVIYSNPIVEIKGNEFGFYDIHDVIFFENHYYIVSTHSNEIIKFTDEGKEIRRWGFPGENDSMHINCIAVWENKIVFSAFGDFDLHRGYKKNSIKTGFVKDLYSGKELISGLSQPHSLVSHGKNLILANSETGEVLEYSPQGSLIRAKALEGYTRGIAIQNDILYVGISKTRNSPDIDNSCAAIIGMDINTLEIIEKIDVPFDEIYSIVPAQQETLIKYYESISEYVLRREAHILTIEQTANLQAQIELQQNEFDLKIQNINEENEILRAKWDAHRTELEMTIGNIKHEKNEIQDALLQAQRMEYELKLVDFSGSYDKKIDLIKDDYEVKINSLKQSHSDFIYKLRNEKEEIAIENQKLIAQLSELQLSNERNILEISKRMLEKESDWLGSISITQRNSETKISLLETIINEKKETIHYQDLVLSEMRNTSESHVGQLALFAEQIESLQNQLSKQELLAEQVESLQSQLAKQTSQQQQSIIEQSESINLRVSELEKEKSSLDEMLALAREDLHLLRSESLEIEHSRKCHILELEMAVDAKAQQMNRELKKLSLSHQEEVNKILSSRSWRLTAPLRYASENYSKFKVQGKQTAIGLYHKAPLSISTRKRLKDFLFNTAPVFFRNSSTYQNWKIYKDLQMISVDQLIETTAPQFVQDNGVVYTENKVGYPVIQDLQPANGVWEWETYLDAKNVMGQVRKKLNSAEPVIPHLIDIGSTPLKTIAATISLPKLEAQPVVSIILPVYNNIKLTLECILSIQQYSGSSISYEIILADDASSDESEDILSNISNLKYIRNKQNLGFLRNCNNALNHASGEYTIYLNNDVQVTEGWLGYLYDTFILYPNVGAVGPKFIYPSGHLQEAGAAFNADGTATMIGLNENPLQERFSYTRRVDYVSGACLMLPTALAKKLEGFSEDFLPCYCEDSDLCLRIEQQGYFIYCNPSAVLIHHLSKTTAAIDNSFKMKCIVNNVDKLKGKWSERFQKSSQPRVIALYLPQFHPFPENDKWWGVGFTEWTNVAKAKPNFVGHYQPRLPADLGYYDLRLPEVMAKQTEMAKQYGIGGFCFYYYWFDGKRLLERPIEQLLLNKSIDFPFCVCWANENWTRRWDGQEHDVLMAQAHSPEDDRAVILDLIRYFKDERYIKIDGKPLIVIYRVTLFPDFKATAELWRKVCIEEGVGEIYIAMVESFDLVHSKTNPKQFGCDAAIEFPPQGLADQKAPSGEIINPDFAGAVADYKSLAVRYATREQPAYTRFMGAMPGWDNTARRQNNSFCFEHATPGVFQAWLEEIFEQTRLQHYGDERIVFINAWNEWAEGAYLEPDKRFGHSYLEAVRNALDANKLLKSSTDY